MPILAHYEVEHDGETVVLLLTEHDADKLNARLVDEYHTATKMRTPRNKIRTPANKAHQ